jgi:hypothetical protein
VHIWLDLYTGCGPAGGETTKGGQNNWSLAYFYIEIAYSSVELTFPIRPPSGRHLISNFPV